MQSLYPTRERLVLSLTAAGVCAAAVLTGIYVAIWIVAPLFPNSRSGVASARELAERFGPRTVDLSMKYPDPSPYRTPTPEFNLPDVPPGTAVVKQDTRTRLVDGRASFDGAHDPQYAGDQFGYQTSLSQPRTPHRRPDRHTDNMF